MSHIAIVPTVAPIVSATPSHPYIGAFIFHCSVVSCDSFGVRTVPKAQNWTVSATLLDRPHTFSLEGFIADVGTDNQIVVRDTSTKQWLMRWNEDEENKPVFNIYSPGGSPDIIDAWTLSPTGEVTLKRTNISEPIPETQWWSFGV